MKKLRMPLSELIAPEDRETLMEMQHFSRVLTMTIRASILVLAIGGITVLVERQSSAAIAVTGSGRVSAHQLVAGRRGSAGGVQAFAGLLL